MRTFESINDQIREAALDLYLNGDPFEEVDVVRDNIIDLVLRFRNSADLTDQEVLGILMERPDLLNAEFVPITRSLRSCIVSTIFHQYAILVPEQIKDRVAARIAEWKASGEFDPVEDREVEDQSCTRTI